MPSTILDIYSVCIYAAAVHCTLIVYIAEATDVSHAGETVVMLAINYVLTYPFISVVLVLVGCWC